MVNFIKIPNLQIYLLPRFLQSRPIINSHLNCLIVQVSSPITSYVFYEEMVLIFLAALLFMVYTLASFGSRSPDEMLL